MQAHLQISDGRMVGWMKASLGGEHRSECCGCGGGRDAHASGSWGLTHHSIYVHVVRSVGRGRGRSRPAGRRSMLIGVSAMPQLTYVCCGRPSVLKGRRRAAKRRTCAGQGTRCVGILLCEYNLFTGGRKSGSRTDGGAAAAASEILPPYCHGILL